MTDAAKIASGLTKAQAHWLPWFTPEPFAGRPVGMAKATLRGLIEKGLVGEQRPKHFGMVKWWITPLGIAVRAELERIADE